MQQSQKRLSLVWCDQTAEQHDLDGYLLLAAAVEPHAHLDKAFLAERVENPTGDLIGAITAMQASRHLIDVADTPTYDVLEHLLDGVSKSY